MRAWVLHGIGALRFEEVARPVPKEQEVLLKVKAAGICGSDIPRIYQNGAHVHPLIPGHEFSGVVAEVGAGVDASWLGRRAGVFPLIPCSFCEPCRKGHHELCRDHSYIGSRRDGAFAEYVTVPVWNLFPVPESVSFEEAAMLEPMAVAVHAMRRLGPSRTDRIAVCGLGTIGLLLLLFLKEAGVGHILAIGNKESQKRAALELGVDPEDYHDSRRQAGAQVAGWIQSRTGGLGADVFFECVGKEETYRLAVESAAPSGRVMLVGNPFSDMQLERDRYWKILRDQLTVMGTWNSSFRHQPEDDWAYVLDRLAQERIAPDKLISHRFSLEEMEKGLHIMRDKTEDYKKVMGIFS